MYFSPRIVTSNLVLALDAADKNSYPGTGTTWKDLTGKSSNGTLNGATFDSGNLGSIVVNGSTTYASVPYQSGFNMGLSDFTISIWVKIDTQLASGGFRKFMLSTVSNIRGYAVGVDSFYSKFTLETWAASSGYTTTYSTITYTSLLNKWANFVTIRQNGATNNGQFYINGVYDSFDSILSVNNISATNQLTIGVGASVDAFFFKGNIASAQVYNRALTAAEVLQNYNATKSRFGR